jgi:hypothetical protein
MYFSVTESSSHFFIYYVAFHGRSWIAGLGDEHENDGEGCIMLVRKDGTQFGKLEAMLTMFHDVFKMYRATTNIGPFSPVIAFPPISVADLTFEQWSGRQHPRTFQEQGGHGFTACPSDANCNLGGNDSLKYRPFADSQTVNPPPDVIANGAITFVGYKLLPLSDLFSRRLDRPTFADGNHMAGNDSGGCGAGFSTCNDNAVTAIWTHGMAGLAASSANGTGEDPGALFSQAFVFTNGLTPPTSDYVQNPLLHQKCEGTDANPLRRLKGSADPCVQQICAVDPFCCNNAWDGVCAARVASTCGKTCSNCTASICTAKATPIGTGCDGRCAASICAVDPFCCNSAWDDICVSEVGSVCHLDCSNLVGVP